MSFTKKSFLLILLFVLIITILLLGVAMQANTIVYNITETPELAASSAAIEPFQITFQTAATYLAVGLIGLLVLGAIGWFLKSVGKFWRF